MSEHYLIVLERDNGEHNLQFGEYYLDTTNHTLYIGISDFGNGGGITPVGTIVITENGTYDVQLYASAEVNVSVPSGTLTITQNGTYDVRDKESVIVNIPQVVIGTLLLKLTGYDPNFKLAYISQERPTLQLAGYQPDFAVTYVPPE